MPSGYSERSSICQLAPPILQLPMSFISMDMLGPYNEMENRHQYVLTVICMPNNCFHGTYKKHGPCIFKPHLFHFGWSKYILTDRGGEFFSKQFTWLAKGIGFIKVYTSPYTPTGNSVIERAHSFLKTSLWKIINNHNTDWNSIAHIAAINIQGVSTLFIRNSPLLCNVQMGCLHAHCVVIIVTKY